MKAADEGRNTTVPILCDCSKAWQPCTKRAIHSFNFTIYSQLRKMEAMTWKTLWLSERLSFIESIFTAAICEKIDYAKDIDMNWLGRMLAWSLTAVMNSCKRRQMSSHVEHDSCTAIKAPPQTVRQCVGVWSATICDMIRLRPIWTACQPYWPLVDVISCRLKACTPTLFTPCSWLGKGIEHKRPGEWHRSEGRCQPLRAVLVYVRNHAQWSYFHRWKADYVDGRWSH